MSAIIFLIYYLQESINRWEFSPHTWRWFLCKQDRWHEFLQPENFLSLHLPLKAYFCALLTLNIPSSKELITFTPAPWFPPWSHTPWELRTVSLTFSLSRRNDLVRMQGNLGGGAAGVRAAPVEPLGFRDAVHLRGLLHRKVHGVPEGQWGPVVRGPARAGRHAPQRLTSAGSGLLHLRWVGSCGEDEAAGVLLHVDRLVCRAWPGAWVFCSWWFKMWLWPTLVFSNVKADPPHHLPRRSWSLQ